jgi:hypothetical protein
MIKVFGKFSCTGRTRAQSQLFVIDGCLTDDPSIVDSVPTGAAVLVLRKGPAPLDVIAHRIAQEPHIKTLHILGHAKPGVLSLAGQSVTVSDPDDLATWAKIGTALAYDADILIYGCDFAKDAATINALSDITGATIAAASHPVGHADFGGSWDLDQMSGVIASRPFTAPQFAGVLTGSVAQISLRGFIFRIQRDS